MNEVDNENVLDPGQERQRLTQWQQEPSLMELKRDLDEAKPHHDSQVKRIEQYLENLNPPDHKAGPGKSKVQPKLIRKQAEWRYAALTEPFLSSDKIFKAEPVTWEDRAAAEQNELVLNHQFTNQMDRVAFIDEYIRTAVDEGTVIIRTGWEFEEEEYEAEVPVVQFTPDPSQAPLYQQLEQLAAESPSQYATDVPEELKQAHAMVRESGVPVRVDVVGYETQPLTRTVVNRPTAEICNTRNVIVDPSCHGDITKARFVVHSFESSLSELRKDGKYTNLDQIQVTHSSPLAEPDHSTTTPDAFNFEDTARKRLVVYEYWGYRDIDGSGIVRPIVAAWVGNVLIRLEENPYPDKKLPFVLVQYLPVRKSLYGEPDGALLEDNQKILGAVTRGMIDIMGRSANGQTGIRKDALDPINRRKFALGQDYEFNANIPDPRMAVYMHTYPEIPASAQFMLQWMNADAESLTGVKSFADVGMSGAALGDTATGIRGVLDAASKRELGILRRLAKGVVEIGRKFMAMNSEFLSEEEVIRITNEEFVTVKRDDLAGRIDLKLTISTAEEDQGKAQELAFLLQTTGNSLPFPVVQRTLAEIFRLRKMPDMAKEIQDYQPEPDPIEQEARQLENEMQKAKIQEILTKLPNYQAQTQLNQAKAASLASETDLKNLEFVEQESGVKQARDLEKIGEQARSQAQLKLLDREMQREKLQTDLVKEYIKAQKTRQA